MASLAASLPLGPLQPLPPVFFQSLCPFCLFLSARVFRLVCIPYTHTTQSPSLVISRLFALDLVLLPPQVSDVRDSFPLSFFLPLLSGILFSFSANLWICLLYWLPVCPHCLQLYGEYREQLGNFARREAARLLTERQWRRQAGDTAATGRKGHGRRHHHHPVTLESHHSPNSSTKKPRPYSKCQGANSFKHTHSCASRRWNLQHLPHRVVEIDSIILL